MKSLDKKKTKELEWEKEFELWCDVTEVDRVSRESIKGFITELLSTQRQEILDEVLKTIGKVKYYKCKDTNSIDYGEMIPCERIDIDELRKAINNLKQK